MHKLSRRLIRETLDAATHRHVSVVDDNHIRNVFDAVRKFDVDWLHAILTHYTHTHTQHDTAHYINTTYDHFGWALTHTACSRSKHAVELLSVLLHHGASLSTLTRAHDAHSNSLDTSSNQGVRLHSTLAPIAAKFRLFALLTFILQQQPSLVHVKDADGFAPAHYIKKLEKKGGKLYDILQRAVRDHDDESYTAPPITLSLSTSHTRDHTRHEQSVKREVYDTKRVSVDSDAP